jgi:hypothetical protein
MRRYIAYQENGDLKEWYKRYCKDRNLDPYEEFENSLDSGDLELFGHECWNCGRTWSDDNDDRVNECYMDEGCNNHD